MFLIILDQVADAVAGEAILGGETIPAAEGKTTQAVPRADPEHIVIIHAERSDVVARQTVGLTIQTELPNIKR